MQSTADTAPAATIAFRDVLSDDGTRLRAWTNDPDHRIEGPTVLLCNGLGTSAFAWPALLDPACGVRVVSWNHRGTGGSDRPARDEACGVDELVQDALSVMDHFGLDRVVVMGWSIGVNTMFQLAVDHPERVQGLFAVAGVPGDTFSSMLGPLRLPRPAARAVTVNLSRVVRLAGRAITPVTTRLPIGERAIAVLSHSGFMFPVADPQLAAAAVKAFLATPIDWYFHMALTTSLHRRVSLSGVDVPCVLVAGRWDVLAGARHIATAAERLPDASYVELPGSHFVQMEHPAEVHRLLLDLLARVSDDQVA
ncbi:alpha/beta fold hydrolase [Nocardioides marmotae]|uniref:alpha/beta fold hydrolase n=1 Tax=Nocardioides marmotae TaxID=2663857 RepID=UPI0012B5BA0C|nr:alpha/beta hydrolase [Nocardioides marmotae]MBC9735009.1 alpha/beta hydrolase [Nocardioides marmotae]MTB86108.1 alpha/beta fold hydrolase [Nocardioides marmotae]